MTLKGGFVSTDRRLDRLPEFDERSRGFAISATVAEVAANRVRSYTWNVPAWLDQGQEGRCVEFAICHELLARPVMVDPLKIADILQHLSIYHPAQHDDYWDGCYLGPRCPIAPSANQYEGTSVLAGMKQAKALGFFEEYRWAFGVQELASAIGYHGPAVIGVNWHPGMFRTDANGFIHPTGAVAGGHAILVRGIKCVYKTRSLLRRRGRSFDDLDLDRSYFILRNSWGRGWGIEGDCKISVRNMQTLLAARGECCLPVIRSHGKAA